MIIALDDSDVSKARSWVDKFEGLPCILKVGLELFSAGGPEWISYLKKKGHRVFLDLKYYDIPHTVARAAKVAAQLQVDFFTAHLMGGKAMFDAIHAELLDHKNPPCVLGVSVLTSYDETSWKDTLRLLNPPSASSTVAFAVQNLVAQGVQWKVGGVVCSALEVESLRKQFPNLFTVVPGIRLPGDGAQDQKRVVTPGEAARLGASAIVVGRSITQSSHPRQTAAEILKSLGWD